MGNSGDTPTRNMVMHTQCVMRNEPLPPGFDFDYPTIETGTAFLGAKATAMGGLAPRLQDPAVSPQDILDVQQGRRALYMWGWTRYSDVFPDTPRHITRFCWIILPVGDPMNYDPRIADSLRFDWILHAEGNCADEECE